MNLKLSVILAFILAVLTDLANSAATTCNDTLQCTGCHCVSANNSMTFAKGDNTTLCAHFVTVENTTGCITAYRAAYPVVVDTFSSIQLTGGQLYFQNYSQNYGFVGIVIQVYGNVSSVPLTYLQLTEFYSSAFSIIIELNNGVVQSAYWDHQCATCSSSDCYQFNINGTGPVIDSICNSPSCITTNDSSSCDPQIYVAWIGTDSNGNQLTSAGMRLSRFDQFSISDIVSAKTIPTYVPTNTTNSTNSSTSGGSTNGTTNTTDSNKTDTTNTTTTNTTTTNTTDSNKTDTANTTTTNTTATNTTDTNKTTTETSTSTSSSDSSSSSSGSSSTTTGSSTGTDTSTTKDTTPTTTTGTDTSTSSGSSATDAGSSTSTGTDTSTTKDDTTATTDTSATSGSSTTDAGSSTSTGTDTSTTKDDPTTVTKL